MRGKTSDIMWACAPSAVRCRFDLMVLVSSVTLPCKPAWYISVLKQMTRKEYPSPPASSISESRRERERNYPRWASVAISVVPWIVPAVVSLYLKYNLLRGTDSYDSGGFKLAYQYVAKIGQPYTIWDRASFFCEDITIGLLIGLALFVLARYIAPRWRLLMTTTLSAGITIALYIQLRAYHEVGQFISFRMLLVAFSWGWHEPGAYWGYIGAKPLFAVLIAVVCLGVLSWVRRRIDICVRQPRRGRRWQTAISMATSAVIAITLVPAVLAVSTGQHRLHSTPYHASALLNALRAYFGNDPDVKTSEFAGLTTQELLQWYVEFVNAPAFRSNSGYLGAQCGSNVLFFVFETLPVKFLPADDKLNDLPNLRRLRDRSFVALRHHSTFPRTHEAVFSLLSSWYASDVMRTFEEQHPDIVVPNMMRTLSALGYQTAIYSPLRRWRSMDEEMFQALGVQRQSYPPDAMRPASKQQKDLRAEWERTRIARDQATLELLKQDLEHWLTNGQHFAGVFLPQIGHIPYPDVAQDSGEKDLRKQARSILAMQDAWLGELLEVLDRHRQLEDTVIIVTGDHGTRTRGEDPTLDGSRMIDDSSFHVPLLIYAPRALQHKVEVSWVTSHIDVAPSVLELLGVTRGRDFEQGSTLWNPKLANRSTYFLASSLFGQDGYYRDGKFYMWNHMTDSVYANTDLHFESSNVVPEASSIDDEVSLSIRRMIGLQQAWATRFDAAQSMRNQLYERAARGH